MKHILYGKKMLVADLIVTSTWALFAIKSMPWLDSWMLAIIFMRIILCFQLYSKSDWSGYCAIVFAGLYFITPNHFIGGFSRAVTDMMYYAIHIVDWNLAHDIFLHTDTLGFMVCHAAIWIGVSLWLAVLPIVYSAISKTIFGFPKWSWINIVLLLSTTILGLWGYTWSSVYAYAIWVVISCFLPEIVWLFRFGNKRSLAAILFGNRPLMFYLGFVSLFLSAFVIGLRNVYTLEFIGLVSFPAIFYVLLAKSAGGHQISTFDTVTMSVCGAIYWYCMGMGITYKVAALIVAIIVVAVIGIRLIRQTSNRFVGFALIIGTTLVLCPALLGMNPYKVLDARHTHLYMKKIGSYNGLYVTDNYERKYGLRDRYGEILPMKYFSIDVIDPSRQNILCCEEVFSDNAARPTYESYYTFFDLNNRRFIEIPDNIPIRSFEEICKGVFNLYNESDKPVFRLVMPGCGENWGNEYELLDLRDYSNPQERVDNLPDYADVYTSRDGKVTIYSWDTGLGGTSPDYVSYIRYNDGDSIITDYFYPHSSSKYVCAKDVKDNGYEVLDGSYVRNLWQYDVPDENPLYIVSAYYRSSSIEGSSMAFALQFDNGKLIKKKFVTDTDEIADNIERAYYIPDWHFLTSGLGWDWLISFDEETKCLYVPPQTDNPYLTDKYDVYHYEHGKLFCKRYDAGYWLHPSIREFNRLEGIYLAEEKLYRIDSVGVDEYRLARWKKGDSISKQPELILTVGKEGIIDNTITFSKDEYEYIVTIPDDLIPDYDKCKFVIKRCGIVIKEIKD